MTREEIIKLIWDRMQNYNKMLAKHGDEGDFTRAYECKAILNLICTAAELRQMQESK